MLRMAARVAGDTPEADTFYLRTRVLLLVLQPLAELRAWGSVARATRRSAGRRYPMWFASWRGGACRPRGAVCR